MDASDVEGCAWNMLRDADLVGHTKPKATKMALRLGLTIVLDGKPGKTWYERYDRIHVYPTSDDEKFQDDVAHETSHAGQTDYGVPEGEQEPYTDQVATCWRIPRYGVLKLYRKYGFIPEMFVRYYRSVCSSPVDILRRCASICEVSIIVHSPTYGRQLFADSLNGPLNIEMGEREEEKLVKEVKLSGRAKNGPFGVVAFPFSYGKAKKVGHRMRGVVLVLDLERALLLGQAAE